MKLIQRGSTYRAGGEGLDAFHEQDRLLPGKLSQSLAMGSIWLYECSKKTGLDVSDGVGIVRFTRLAKNAPRVYLEIEFTHRRHVLGTMALIILIQTSGYENLHYDTLNLSRTLVADDTLSRTHVATALRLAVPSEYASQADLAAYGSEGDAERYYSI